MEDAAAAGMGIVMLLVSIVAVLVGLLIALIPIIAMFKIYGKAGKPGWAVIVPIYNVIVLLEIVGRPLWWIVLMMIPVCNLIVAIIVAIDMAKSFGKGAGFGIGLAFFPYIFYPVLGFSSAQYVGPAAGGGGYDAY